VKSDREKSELQLSSNTILCLTDLRCDAHLDPLSTNPEGKEKPTKSHNTQANP